MSNTLEAGQIRIDPDKRFPERQVRLVAFVASTDKCVVETLMSMGKAVSPPYHQTRVSAKALSKWKEVTP